MDQDVFDPRDAAQVLADLLGRQRGRVVAVELEPGGPDGEDPAGVLPPAASGTGGNDLEVNFQG